MPLSASQAYNALVANPVNFLKTYTLRMAGTGKGKSGEYMIALGAYDVSENGMELKKGAHDQFFKMGPPIANKDDADLSMAHVIEMDWHANDIKPYTLDQNGSDVMITGELTGCCFIIWEKGQGAKVAHVKPNGFEPAELRAFLQEEHPGAQIIYGHELNENERGMYGKGRAVSIFGVRGADGQWRIYAQKRDSSQRHKYCSLYMIYPQHRKM